jgi:hypothetical protein
LKSQPNLALLNAKTKSTTKNYEKERNRKIGIMAVARLWNHSASGAGEVGMYATLR